MLHVSCVVMSVTNQEYVSRYSCQIIQVHARQVNRSMRWPLTSLSGELNTV